jgi:hypothetical protein
MRVRRRTIGAGRITVASALLLLLLVSAAAVPVAGASLLSTSYTGVRGASVTITGTVLGKGGTGKTAWTVPVAGAQVKVDGSAQPATTDAAGRYVLVADVSASPTYQGIGITATHKSYVKKSSILGSANPQVQDFTLTVAGTTLKVTVKAGRKAVKGAKVMVFSKSAKTNAKGLAQVRSLQLKPATKYTCTITKKGYKKAKFKFAAKPNGTVKKTVKLKK